MEQPKRKLSIGLIIGIVAAAVVACIALVLILIFVVFNATAPAANAADAFMTALKDKDYAAAYDLCTRDLRAELESASNLRQMVEDNNAGPVSWNFTSRSVDNDQAVISGDGVFTAGREADVEIVLQNVDGAWKVAGFHFNWK
jgi:hypothetical protein